ncbi:maltodextrin glucosidase [Dactylosporangium fulvum]|uniref:Alpha-amylase family glycosyl hydrolase n=1 Tax=Dactylosporangium fulvum TaxID=53359 RepID=A0ABY5WDA3_9ACTN|nr:glycoside hydrolase family 13 protein [Dactylosporangium fulvum]UWP87241.1 alpha-amylase family glycosyl hydrolase [Dactylosporangium fulvum]
MIHHDGSALYVPDQNPRLGSTVDLWLRTAPGTTSVHVRSVEDGEPRFTEAVPSPRGNEIWWRAAVHVRNPVTRYRFLVDGDWYTATGRAGHDVPDATDFRLVTHPAPPPWTREAIVYQIFPDRFDRAGSAPAPDWAEPADWHEPVRHSSTQWYGGDLDGVTRHLDHIQDLGADTVYLTPFFPARSNHRYDAASFDHVDPLLGGDRALRRLADALHTRGMRLIGDLTTNHTGDTHPWFAGPLAEPDLYYTTPDGGFETWMGVPSLPKLNWGSPRLRERLVTAPDSVVKRWLRYLDGWRIDVANMTGRRGADDLTHTVSRLLAREIRAVRPDALLLAEHAHGAGGDLDVDGWQGTMNYAGFLRPLWTWLHGPSFDPPDFIGVPGGIPRRDGTAVVRTMRAVMATMSWRSWTHSWNLLGSHDTARIHTVTGDPARSEVAMGLLATLPGVPMLFAGDEFGLHGTNGELSRTPVPWGASPLRWYGDLLALRRKHAALRNGGLRFAHVDADRIVFWRETADDRMLVLAARAPGAPVPLPLPADATNLYGGASVPDALRGDGPTFQVWSVPA